MFAKKSGKHIVKLSVTVNLNVLPQWLQAAEHNIPIVPYSQWREGHNFEYRVFRLPSESDKDWYFHKSANEFSHSFNAIINLRPYFETDLASQTTVEDGSPDLELRLWRGQMSIGFFQRPILVAPLTEMVTLTNTGKTSQATQPEPRNQMLEVPVGFDHQQPSAFMSVYESVDAEAAAYSNQLVNFSMKAATDPVRS